VPDHPRERALLVALRFDLAVARHVEHAAIDSQAPRKASNAAAPGSAGSTARPSEVLVEAGSSTSWGSTKAVDDAEPAA